MKDILGPPTEGVSTPPKHRRCTRYSHHVWEIGRITGTGWRIARCVSCGLEDLT